MTGCAVGAAAATGGGMGAAAAAVGGSAPAAIGVRVAKEETLVASRSSTRR